MTHRANPELGVRLRRLYEEVMWLAARPNVSPSMARAWYTHVVAGKFRLQIRQFSGKVSKNAASDPTQTLRLEHHGRIQTRLTSLVKRHCRQKRKDPSQFIQLILDCENVHIVTFDENYAARKSAGDYSKAGISLRAWDSIAKAKREILWSKMLRGKVANAADFKP